LATDSQMRGKNRESAPGRKRRRLSFGSRNSGMELKGRHGGGKGRKGYVTRKSAIGVEGVDLSAGKEGKEDKEKGVA